MRMISSILALLLLSSTVAYPNDSAQAAWAAILASSERTFPLEDVTPTDYVFGCCKICSKGKPCGDTCIAQDKICHVGPGCAC